MAWVRALMAVVRTTRSMRMASTGPVFALGVAWAVWASTARGGPLSVQWVGLSAGPAVLAILPVDLNDLDALANQEPGQPSTVAAGAFHPNCLELAVAAQPAQQGRVASRGGRESGMHAQLGEPGQGAGGEASRGRPVLAVTGLHIGQTGAVIHRHMQIVIAQPMAAVVVGATPPSSEQPMPTAIGDPPLGLDIDMEQLTWPLALVADHLPRRAVQLPQPWQLVTAQHRMHRGGASPSAQPIRCGPTRWVCRQARMACSRAADS